MADPNFLTIDLSSYLIDSTLIESIPSLIVTQHQFMPVFKIGKTLTIATSDPDNLDHIDVIRKELDMEIDTLFAPEEDIKKSIAHYYGVLGSIEDLISKANTDETKQEKEGSSKEVLKLSESDYHDSPVVKLVNLIISQALIKDASDIHIEPMLNDVLVRLRIDGDMQELKWVPKHLLAAIVSRIKVMGGMDIAESRIPQDGRVKVEYESKDVELRISSLPTIHGENIVIRLLSKKKSVLALSDLGLSDEDLDTMHRLASLPQGMLLVTGPTGSGKTTTLYAALSYMNQKTKNIITLEDPVEYELPLVRQVQVNAKAGLTFSTGLRSILRQDPDIIMVGEIRDLDTAELSVRAALTGHLVLSTLHTNDAPSTIIRLVDMGIPSFLVSSSLTGVLTQRLVRRTCDKCKVAYRPTPMVMKLLNLDENQTYYQGKGCKSCHQSGYKGRLALFEILILTDDLRREIVKSAASSDLRRLAMEHGMKSLVTDGKRKIALGVTTAEEVFKVAQFLVD